MNTSRGASTMTITTAINATNSSTVGYGDLVLPQPWRMLGPIEGLTGILMCGLPTGLYIALITRLIGPRFKAGGPPGANLISCTSTMHCSRGNDRETSCVARKTLDNITFDLKG